MTKTGGGLTKTGGGLTNGGGLTKTGGEAHGGGPPLAQHAGGCGDWHGCWVTGQLFPHAASEVGVRLLVWI